MPEPSASQREGDAPCASFIPAPDTDTAMLTPQPTLQTMKALPDTFLDPWRTARSCAAQSLLQWASSLIARYEESLPARGKAAKNGTTCNESALDPAEEEPGASDF